MRSDIIVGARTANIVIQPFSVVCTTYLVGHTLGMLFVGGVVASFATTVLLVFHTRVVRELGERV